VRRDVNYQHGFAETLAVALAYVPAKIAFMASKLKIPAFF